jgi:hypothetical protein
MNIPPGIRRLIRPAALVSVGLLVGGGLVVLGNHDGGAKKAQSGEIAASASTTTTTAATIVTMVTTEAPTTTTAAAVSVTTQRPTTTTTKVKSVVTTTTAPPATTTTTTTRPPVTTTTAPPATATTTTAPAGTWTRVDYSQPFRSPSPGYDTKAGKQYQVYGSCGSGGLSYYGCSVKLYRGDGYLMWSKSLKQGELVTQGVDLPPAHYYLVTGGGDPPSGYAELRELR